jgi:GC-rich sequence DNA-binding factor-like protein/RhoGAP domain
VEPQEHILELSHLIASLLIANYSLLHALTAHLILIVQNSTVNKMNMRNVDIVFSSMSTLTSTFRTWKQALTGKVNLVEQSSQTQVNLYGAGAATPLPVIEPMTPFESLLWNIWLPKVRMSINNRWDFCDSVIKLYETWASFLPPLITCSINSFFQNSLGLESQA